jgi:hypothetical protein
MITAITLPLYARHLPGLRRLQWPVMLLVALLQRAPALPASAGAHALSLSGVGVVIKCTIASVLSLGAVDTLVGATQLTANPTSPASASVGQAFQAALSITGAPLVPGSYEVTGQLPPGVTVTGMSGDLVNASSLTLSGTPTTAGSYTLNIRAWAERNKAGLGGTPTFNYTIEVGGGSTQTAPAFSTHPQSQTVNVGSNVTLSVTVTGSPDPTLQWRKDGVDLAGATGTSLVLSNISTSQAGEYRVVATNAAGTATSQAAVVTVNAPSQTPRFSTHPLNVTARTGSTAVLTVGTVDATSYQWFRDGNPVAGATTETLVLDQVASDAAGSYTVTASNASGSTNSQPGVVSIAANGTSRISNLSVRTNLGAGSTLIVGFVSVGEKSILLRAAGPSLLSVAPSLTGVHDDPRIRLFNGSTQTDENDDWEPALSPTFAATGAFPFVTGARDAALLHPVVGARTAHITGPGSGIVLVETYDAGGTGRLTNVSARNRVGTGSNVLIAGFVISGSVGKTLLVRGMGPRLSELGVPNVLADPKLEVYNAAGTKIAENDNWNAALNHLAGRAGAGGLAIAPGGRDAGLVLTLNPGLYTAIVSGVDQTTGEALVEVYEVP